MKMQSAILQISMRLAFLGVLAGIALPTGLARAQKIDEEKEEDPERITRFWRTALSPDDYMRALEITGMLSPTFRKAGQLSDTDWQAVGPTGDHSAAFPFNGRIRSIHIQSIGSDYYVYAGASSGGIWRALGSTGPVWTSLGDNLPNPAVGAFAVHPSNPNNILVGTGDYKRYHGAGMFHTTDAGRTWSPISLPDSPGAFFRIYYLPGNSNIVIAVTTRGLFRSTNGAAGPWTLRLNGLISDLAIHPAFPDTQYCCRATSGGTGGGIWKSSNAGIDWTRLASTGTPPANAVGIGRIAICRNAPTSLLYAYEESGFIGTVNGQRYGGILKSSNAGGRWADITGNVQLGQAFHALAVAIRPNNPNELYVGPNNLQRSTTGGTGTNPWQDVTGSIAKHQDQTQLYFSPVTGENTLWVCNDGGIYRHTIGGSTVSWNGNQSTGLRVGQVYQIDAQRDLRLAALQDNGIAGSTNIGTNWSGFENSDGEEVEITNDLNNPVFWYISGVYPRPNWRTFRQTFDGLPRNELSSPDSHRRLFFDRFNDRIYSVNADGSPFHVVSSPASGTLIWREESVINTRATHLSGSYLNSNTLFAYNYWSPDTLTVLQKTSTGWSTYTATFGVNRNVAVVFASNERPGESWVGLRCETGLEDRVSVGCASGAPKILHTTNFWRSWTDISGSLANVGAVNAIVVAPFNSREIYAATDFGVFRTQNSGMSWEPFQSGLPIVGCTDLRYIIDRTRAGNDKLVVATFGRGLYECTINRQPLVYVDPSNIGVEDGTFEHPYNTFNEGHTVVPNRGVLALRGNIYTVPVTLVKPMTINAYESTAQLQH